MDKPKRRPSDFVNHKALLAWLNAPTLTPTEQLVHALRAAQVVKR